MFLLVLSFLGNTSMINPRNPTDTVVNKQIKEVEVVAGTANVFSLPMAVVEKKTLDASSYFTPADALRTETGISLVRDAPWATSLNVRGLSEQRLIVMSDGDRIQTATDHSAALSVVDLNSLEKIEVVKGASSVLYGTGAMGGVVNFVSERPTYTPVLRSKGRIETEFNTVNSGWANSANVQFTTNKWYLTLNGSFRTAGNTQTPQGVLPNSQFHDASWSVRGGILYSKNQEVLVNYQHVGGWDIGLPGGRSFPATAVARYTGIERNQLSGEYIVTKINPNLREVRFKAYTQNISRDVELKPNATVLLFPGSKNETSGAKLTSDWRFTDYHNLTLGAEGWVRDAKTYRIKVENTTDTTSIVTGDQPTPKAQMIDMGIFAHYSWKIYPRKWTLNAGLRLDYMKITNDTAFSPLYKYTVNKGKITDLKVRNTLYLPSVIDEIPYAAHIDLVYNPTSQQQLTFMLANSYRAASIEERFKYINLGGAIHLGNPNIKSEKGTFSNLNYTLAGRKIRIKADVFVNVIADFIAEKLTAPSTYTLTNISNAMFLGSELEGEWKINPQFSLLANASYTQARDLDANTPLPQIPPMSGFASFNYQSKKQIGASFSALWAASQNEIAACETATAGHIIYNLNIHSGDIALNNSELELFAGIDNLLNTAYMDHLSTTRGILKLEPGRNVYLKVKWGW
jgi:hemoglobin/transferrin/lactoferrin receptor protein